MSMSMRLRACALAAIGASSLLAVIAPASATTEISIGASTTGIGAPTLLVSGPSSFTTWSGAFGGLEANGIFASDPSPSDPALASTLINVSTGGSSGTVWFYVTETGLTAPVTSLTSSLTQNDLQPGWSVTETTYLGTTAFDLGTQLASQSAPPLFAVVIPSGAVMPGSTYSLTEVYKVSFTSLGSAESTEKISAVTVIPETETWAMMALGFAAIGFAGYRARKSVSVID